MVYSLGNRIKHPNGSLRIDSSEGVNSKISRIVSWDKASKYTVRFNRISLSQPSFFLSLSN